MTRPQRESTNDALKTRMADLETAYNVLGDMVREEYGDYDPLWRIMSQFKWDITEEQTAALKRLEEQPS